MCRLLQANDSPCCPAPSRQNTVAHVNGPVIDGFRGAQVPNTTHEPDKMVKNDSNVAEREND